MAPFTKNVPDDVAMVSATSAIIAAVICFVLATAARSSKIYIRGFKTQGADRHDLCTVHSALSVPLVSGSITLRDIINKA